MYTSRCTTIDQVSNSNTSERDYIISMGNKNLKEDKMIGSRCAIYGTDIAGETSKKSRTQKHIKWVANNVQKYSLCISFIAY